MDLRACLREDRALLHVPTLGIEEGEDKVHGNVSEPGPRVALNLQKRKSSNHRGHIRALRLIIDSLPLIDGVVVFSSAILAEIIYKSLVLSSLVDWGQIVGLAGLGAILAVMIFQFLGTYSEASFLGRIRDVRRVIWGWIAVFGVLVGIGFLTKTSAEFSRGVSILWLFIAAFGLVGVRLSGQQFLNALTRGQISVRRLVLVGIPDEFQRFKNQIIQLHPEVSVDAEFDVGKRVDGTTDSMKEVAERVIQFSRHNQVDEILIISGFSEVNEVRLLVDELAVLPVLCRIALPSLQVHSRNVRVEILEGSPVLTVLTPPLGDWGWLAKLIEDRLLGLFFLAALALPMLCIAIAIKLDSPGRVLFRQRRHGFNNEIIQVLKFRTMTVWEDGAIVSQATRHDPRVTRVGRFLRRWSLDELPQLLNVVKGDMSLVGPRPHAVAHNEHYDKVIARYAARHRVKPGITGLAQIRGLRGETDTADKMVARTAADIEYMETWSIWRDLCILFMTVPSVLFNRNVY